MTSPYGALTLIVGHTAEPIPENAFDRLAQGEDLALAAAGDAFGLAKEYAALARTTTEAGFTVRVELARPSPLETAAALGFAGDALLVARVREARGLARRLRALAQSSQPLFLSVDYPLWPKVAAELARIAPEVVFTLIAESRGGQFTLAGTGAELPRFRLPKGARDLTLLRLDETGADLAAEDILAQGLAPAEAAKRLAAASGITKKEAYRLINAQKKDAATGIEFRAKGHPDIRATHGKTLEIKREDACSPRETCVVAVGADWRPADLKRLYGAVVLTIEAGDLSETVHAEIAPGFASPDRIIVRKSADQTDAATLAVNADKGAADLSRTFAKRLADPDAALVVRIAPAADCK